MSTDTSEQGLERLICIALTGDPCERPKADGFRGPRGSYGGVGWSVGSWLDYDREHCFDLVRLTAFMRDTQPEASESLGLSEERPARRRFLARLQGEVSKRGTIDVFRHGVSHGPHDLKLFYGSPSESILLPDEDAMIDPVPTAGGGGRPEPEIDLLSNILRVFNGHFGDIPWEDADRVRQLITETIPSRVADDTAFRNARRNSDEQNAKIEHDRALLRVMTSVMKDDAELFKQFMDNDGFKRWMTDTVFALAYEQPVTG